MIVIDSEFQSLIPPLTDDEYKLLEESILTEGYHVYEPIITWEDTIIDGHNRYHICDEHGIKFTTKEIQFDSRDVAKIWIIKHQLGRRNLNKAQRMEAVLKLESSIAAEMKRRHAANGGDHGNQYTGGKMADSPKSDAPPKERTDAIMARMADVGKNQMREYKEIVEKADEGDPVAIREKEALLSGEKKSVHGAHQKVFGKKQSRKPTDTTDKDGRATCAMCGEPINKGEAYPSRPTVHKKCEQEYQRDWEKEKRAEKKYKFTEDGRRICSICGEPINEGEAYDYEPAFHKKCRTKQHVIAQRKYRERKRLEQNITIGDVNEVIEHDKAELKRQLMLDARSAWDNLQATLNRYKSMGVTISEDETNRIYDAVNALALTINSIEDGQDEAKDD